MKTTAYDVILKRSEDSKRKLVLHCNITDQDFTEGIKFAVRLDRVYIKLNEVPVKMLPIVSSPTMKTPTAILGGLRIPVSKFFQLNLGSLTLEELLNPEKQTLIDEMDHV